MPVTIGNVIEVKKYGNTVVKVCDDAYRDKTEEELEAVRRQINRAAWNCVMAARSEGKDI